MSIVELLHPRRAARGADLADTECCQQCGHPDTRARPSIRALQALRLYSRAPRCHADVTDYAEWYVECPCEAPFHGR